MTSDQFLELKATVEALWGPNQKWKHARDAYDRIPNVRATPHTQATRALELLSASGTTHAPSIPEVIRKAAELGGDTFDPTLCRHDSGYAIVHESDFGTRTGICQLCRTHEQQFPPGVLLTESERTARAH